MNLTCIICSDLLLPSSVVHVTKCGHMFHLDCLIQWIERSQSCPQCRSKVTEKSIRRVYFIVANTDHVTEDAEALQYKVDSLEFQVTLKDKDIKIYKDRYERFRSKNLMLRQEFCGLETKLRHLNSEIQDLRVEATLLQAKADNTDKLAEEIGQLKGQLKEVEHVQNVIEGAKDDVDDILKAEPSVESLATIIATLKKSLEESEKKNRQFEMNNECGSSNKPVNVPDNKDTISTNFNEKLRGVLRKSEKRRLEAVMNNAFLIEDISTRIDRTSLQTGQNEETKCVKCINRKSIQIGQKRQQSLPEAAMKLRKTKEEVLEK